VPSTSDPVLLLHGQPGNAHDWDAVRTAIGGRVPVLATDRPGWDGNSAPTDLVGNARAAVAVLDAQGIERATVVGHSLGGAIAAWLAIEYPHRVGALLLAAPSASFESLNRLDEILATPFLGAAVATTAFAGIGLTLKIPAARKRVSARFRLPEDYLRAYSRILLSPLAWHAFTVEQRMLVRELAELEARLPAISAPTTIVAGTADRIVSPASARRLAGQIPGAKLVELKESSHLLLQERPSELADLIVEAAGVRSTPAVAAAQDSPGSG
jgi:pimeloyl-ACP methyl ester carboxylesterase